MIRADKDFLHTKIEAINFSIIKIGNIPWEISTRDVVELIDPYLWKNRATRDWVHIPIDRVTGKTLSELFVEIPTIYEAQIICSHLDKHIFKQRALSVSISDYEELMSVLIKPEAVISKDYFLADEMTRLADICANYKIHFSRKCAERPFEHILSLFRLIPWQALKSETVTLMFEVMKRAIESLEFHLNRPVNQIDKDLLPRMIRTAQAYPAFSLIQRQQFCYEKNFDIKTNIDTSSQSKMIEIIKFVQ